MKERESKVSWPWRKQSSNWNLCNCCTLQFESKFSFHLDRFGIPRPLWIPHFVEFIIAFDNLTWQLNFIVDVTPMRERQVTLFNEKFDLSFDFWNVSDKQASADECRIWMLVTSFGRTFAPTVSFKRNAATMVAKDTAKKRKLNSRKISIL